MHLVDDVGGLVHPAPLLPGRRIDLAEGGPEAERAIADGEFRRLREPPLLEIKEQFLPALPASTDAVDDSDQFLPAFGRGSHEDEQPLLLVAVVFQPHVDVDAVGPDVDVLLPREISTARSSTWRDLFRTRGCSTSSGPAPVMMLRAGR